MKKNYIVEVFETLDKNISIDVKMYRGEVWLTLNQMAQLFDRDKSVISRHLKNVFDVQEMDRESVVANFATTAADGKVYQVDYYNLDAILSVGYRVNSKRGVQFRQWSNKVLKSYTLKGYALNKKMLVVEGFDKIDRAIGLLSNTLSRSKQISDLDKQAIQIVRSYARSWRLLLNYDEQKLQKPKGVHETEALAYDVAIRSIQHLRKDLETKSESTRLFGREQGQKLRAILGNIQQTFGSELLYETVEERAAHLLYFVIKDHPFSDGNKRIGSFLFLLYLQQNKISLRHITDQTLVALALLVAESNPKDKELIISLVTNLIQAG